LAGLIAKQKVIPVKDTKHLMSQLVTRYPTTNTNPKAGDKMAKVFRLATNRFPTKVMNARWENTTELSQDTYQ
jgi:hypothetical protein